MISAVYAGLSHSEHAPGSCLQSETGHDGRAMDAHLRLR